MAYSPSTLPDFPASDFGPEFKVAPTVPLRVDDIIVEREVGRPAQRLPLARARPDLMPFADLPGEPEFAIDDEVLDAVAVGEARSPVADDPGRRPSELDPGRIDRERARRQPGLLHLVAAASFVEGAAAIECRRLLDWVPANDELVAWLESRWAPEEQQHGEVLRRYLAHVWPEFDHARGFEAFSRADAARQAQAGFAASPGLEMLARSVTEVGSAVFYRALQEEAAEPHLQQLASRLRRDELRHYRHFQHFFRQFDAQERVGRKRIMRTMWERLHRDRHGRAGEALRQVHALQSAAGGQDDPASSEQALVRRMHERYPIGMPARMLFKSLHLPATWEVLAEPAARLLRRSLA